MTHTAPHHPGMKWLAENLPHAFPLTDDDSDQARDKTLKYWTAEDFRNADYLGELASAIADSMDKAGVRTLGEMFGREGLHA